MTEFKIKCYNTTQLLTPNFFQRQYNSLEEVRKAFTDSGFKILEDFETYNADERISWIRVGKGEIQELVYVFDMKLIAPA